MPSLEFLLTEAFLDLAPSLACDPEQLGKRLERRRRGCRPVRGWSLAIRASDTRLPNPIPPRPDDDNPDCIDLDPGDIHALCSGARLSAQWIPLNQAADDLGQRGGRGLLTARVAGAFDTKYIPGLGGSWGKPRPLLASRHLFDPATRGLLPRDPLWRSALPSLLQRIPPDLPTQTLHRLPHYQQLRNIYQDTDHLHPEHPANDPVPRVRKSLALPPPPGDDIAWYKWKDGQYLGYDWRNPYAEAHFLRRQKRLANIRERCRRQRRENPPLSQSQGSLGYRGWDWICPSCSRRVRVLFLPIPPINMADQLFLDDPAEAYLADEIRAVPFPKPRIRGFACEKCHRIKRYSHCDSNAWNEFVAWATGGLLYGRDVPRPDWLIPERKVEYTPRPRRNPGQRTDQVERALLDGKTFEQIADDLGIAKGTVLWHAQQVYKRHGVQTLADFLKKQGLPAPKPKRQQVLELFHEGHRVPQIATLLNLTPGSVYNHIYMLKKSGKLPRERIHRGNTEMKPQMNADERG